MSGRIFVIITPWSIAPPRFLCPWDFLGKKTRVCWPFLSLEHHPDPGIKPASPTLTDRFFTTEPHGKPQKDMCQSIDIVGYRRLSYFPWGFFCLFGWLVFLAMLPVEFYFPNQGLNPHPLQRKRKVLTTGLPGNSPEVFSLITSNWGIFFPSLKKIMVAYTQHEIYLLNHF